MKRISSILSAILFLAASCAAGPAEAVTAAARDLAGQPEALRPRLRYLTDYALAPAPPARADFAKALAFWTNSLTAEAEPVHLVYVPLLWRVNIDDFGWDRDTWEKLADADPYFHERAESKRTKVWANAKGKRYLDQRAAAKLPKSQRTLKEVTVGGKTRTGFWLPPDDMAFLVNETQSAAPILRADWWLVQTSIQEGRKGTGYYDFLRLKKRTDFEKLVGFSRDLSKRQVRGIVAQSSVALNNRQLDREQSTTGGYWVSLDVTDSIGKHNAVRNLDADYVHEFSEHYGFLPNGLFAYYLSNAQGVQANTAPDTVATDATSPTPDRRVHVGLGCVRCHVEGIRPIDDYGRRTYTPPLALQSPDYAKFKRLQQLYIAELKKWVVRDQGDFAAALVATNGLTPAANAKVFASAWDAYQNRPLSGEDVARELGFDAKLVTAAVKRFAVATGSLDPVVAALAHEPALPVRREHFEEDFSLIQKVVRGYQP